MYCPYCGNHIPENSTTCPQCHERLEEKKEFNISKKVISLGVIVILAIILFFGAKQFGLLEKVSSALAKFPDDYVLKKDELPPNFQLKPVDLSLREKGFSSNPYLISSEFLSAKTKSEAGKDVTRGYLAVYSPVTGGGDLSVLALEFQDEEKLRAAASRTLGVNKLDSLPTILKRGNIMVIIENGDYSSGSAVAVSVNKFIKRLGLEVVTNLDLDGGGNIDSSFSLLFPSPSPTPTPMPTPTPSQEQKTQSLLEGVDSGRPMLGSSSAKVTVVAFIDFEDPFSAKYFNETFNSIDSTYIKTNQIKYVFVHSPLETLFQKSTSAAKHAYCSYKQGKFWEMHSLLFKNQEEWKGSDKPDEIFLGYAEDLSLNLTDFQSCLTSPDTEQAINRDKKLGTDLGINGVPNFFVNGTSIPGAVPFTQFDEAIKKVL